MREKIKELGNRLAKFLMAKNTYDTVGELTMAVFPFFLGAILLDDLSRRQWGPLFVNVLLAGVFATMGVLTQRLRRKRLELCEETIKRLKEQSGRAAELFSSLAAEASTRGGEVLVRIAVQAERDGYRLAVRMQPPDETHIAQMN